MKNTFWLLIFINIINSSFNFSYRNSTITTKSIKNDSILLKSTSKDDILKAMKREADVDVSGLRLETLNEDDHGIFRYLKNKTFFVISNHEIRITVFGFNLNKIDYIGFTNHKNCQYLSIKISKDKFLNVRKRMLTVVTSFPKIDSSYYLCYHLSIEPSNRIFTYANETDTIITIASGKRKYLMPLWIQICLIIFLIIVSGLFSGLNLGLMTLSLQELELIRKSGSKKEKKYAEVIIPIRKSGNLLLCSILIGNVCVNSAISILMDDLTSGIVALIASSAGIVVFGEIVPQSICVKKGLAVGANTIWITKFFMMITFPLAYPISKILDLILGDEVVSYDRKKLLELIKMTKNKETLADELKIAVGAMEIAEKTVKDVMTKIEDVYMLPETTILNPKTVTEIVNSGYTRIPIFANDNKNNVVSLLFIKDLALVDPDENFTIKTVCQHIKNVLRFVFYDTPLKIMLEEFKKGDYHLAMVKNRLTNENEIKLLGVVTLEDIVEEILQAEIVDETDIVMDNVNKIKRRTKNKKYISNCQRKDDNKKSSDSGSKTSTTKQQKKC